MVTADNQRFIRCWYEVFFKKIGFRLSSREDSLKSKCRWFPYQKGGEFRNWYGNQDWVVDWENDGYRLLNMQSEGYKVGSTNHNLEYIFKSAIVWSKVTSSNPCFRYSAKGFLFDDASGVCIINEQENEKLILGLLCSKINALFLSIINPTLNIQPGNMAVLPIKLCLSHEIDNVVESIITISRQDWDNFETSWDFQTHPLLRHNTKHLSQAFDIWQNQAETAFRELQRLEEENNRYWIEAYGLQDELTPEVTDNQITIRRADINKDIRSLMSYAVGCIMGRYSLDKPGLIHAGQPFDPGLHQTLTASSDAIIPITDQAYFDHDIVNRFVEFLRVAYSPDTLTENLNFIANALTLKNGESPLERIRRYFLQEFISDHIQTYKKRPIYWLFTSGKKRAFGALVYLQRYNEDTLARLRTDYVLELQVKLDGEIARAQQQLDTATSTTAKKAANKRLKELQDQQLELRDYQAKLQHLADARIKLDLDDGVAYNYTRFKGLVYEGADLKMADLEKASQWKREIV
jgi:type II restriction/modification system DNA methylase subunit YeeA